MNAEANQRKTEAFFWGKRGKKYKIAEETAGAKCRKGNKTTVEHLLANPEESRQEFFEKYLKQILKRDMDPFMRAKHNEYAARTHEVPLGKEFLARMDADIKARKLDKGVRNNIEVSAGQ